MKTHGYARVSTKQQNVDRQVIALKEQGLDECDIVIEKESGKDVNRAGYIYLKKYILRSGDTLIVTSLDRLSRNKSDIKQELEYFRQHNIRLKVIDLPTTMIDLPAGQEWVFDMVNNILIEVLGTIAEQERETIRKRQAEGIAAAKARGVKFGRPKKELPADFAELVRKWETDILALPELLKLCDISQRTFYRRLREYRALEPKTTKLPKPVLFGKPPA